MDRRRFLRGLIAAPAIVPFASLMPVRGIIMPVEPMWTAEVVWGAVLNDNFSDELLSPLPPNAFRLWIDNDGRLHYGLPHKPLSRRGLLTPPPASPYRA